MLKVGDVVLFSKCSCGDNLSEGATYIIRAVMGDLFMFYDDSGQKRVRNVNSRCFTLIKPEDEKDS